MNRISTISLKDLKYLAALTIPTTAFVGLLIQGPWSYFTPIYAFAVIPVLELLMPQQNNNYDKEELNIKSINKVFDWMLYLNIPIVFGLLLFTITTITKEELNIKSINKVFDWMLYLNIPIVFGLLLFTYCIWLASFYNNYHNIFSLKNI